MSRSTRYSAGEYGSNGRLRQRLQTERLFSFGWRNVPCFVFHTSRVGATPRHRGIASSSQRASSARTRNLPTHKRGSSGLVQTGIEMTEAGHHLVLQQFQRMPPCLRLVLVVEAEHQQRAEAADLAPDRLDLIGDGRRRADDPVARGAILDGDIAIGHVGRVLQIILEAEVTE